jgi:hypothetical protein
MPKGVYPRRPRGAPEPSAAEQLVAGLVRRPNGCLEWTGGTDGWGYGHFTVGGKQVLTHRAAWELANGPIPDDLHVLHHCDNPPCCDTERCLFLGTSADNMADMAAKGRSHTNGNEAKTHCPEGHEYTEANTYTYRNMRSCRKCGRARQARCRARRRNSRLPLPG